MVEKGNWKEEDKFKSKKEERKGKGVERKQEDERQDQKMYKRVDELKQRNEQGALTHLLQIPVHFYCC